MAQLAVLIAGLLLIVESQASDVAEADPSAVQGFLSKYMTAPMQRAWTSNVKHGSEGTGAFVVIDDKPALHPAPQMQDSFAFTSAKEEEKAAAKLLANGSNTPITLSAIGVGLLALVMMLAARIQRGLRPATVSAGMEMQSQAQASMVPNVFYSGGDESKLGAGGMADTRDPEPFVNETDKRQSISQAPSFEEYLKSRQFAADSRNAELAHGFIISLLAASGFPHQPTLKADCVESDLKWNPLDYCSPLAWQPAVFAVSPEPGPLGPANAAAGAVFAGLVAWSFGFAPGELGNPADTQLIELLVTQPVPRPESVNELWFAVWNCFAVVPVCIAALTLPAASRGQRLPAAPFLVGSAAFGYFALGPYFSVRSARTESPIDPEEDFGFFTKNIFETRVFGIALAALAASIPFSSDLLTADPATLLPGYLDLAESSRFVAVASADIAIMSVLAAFLVGEDATRRGWDDYKVPLTAASLLLPVLGPSLYLAARPRIEEPEPVPVEEEKGFSLPQFKNPFE